MLEYLISGISILTTASIGSYFTTKSVKSDWYNKIKPKSTPPNYVFPIVWTILYIMLFFAFADVIQKHDYITIGVFVINLLLNILWCYLYFAMKEPKYALAALILLIITNFIIIWRAYIISSDYYLCVLMLPYTLWLLFVGYLNLRSV